MNGPDRATLEHPFVLSARGDSQQISKMIGDGLAGQQLALVLLFCPEGDKVTPICADISRDCGKQCRVLACSSAGGFSFAGYDDQSVIAIAFPATSFAAKAVWLTRLRQHMALDWMTTLRNLSDGFSARLGQNRFGLLLIDGASGREEVVTATIDATIPELLVLGGSAGDGLRFGQTRLAMDGDERPESALFCMIATDFDIEEIVFDHFHPVGEPMVVTDADPDNRIIHEINAEPAAVEYARLIGLPEAELGPEAFAENPLLTRLGGRHFVRAISGITPEGGLSLMSSIDVGAILTIGRPESLTEGLRLRLEQIGPAELVLGFDCIMRRIAIERAGEQEVLDNLCRNHRLAGFHTYGEQHGGIHVNQTFVGLAFIPPTGQSHAIPQNSTLKNAGHAT